MKRSVPLCRSCGVVRCRCGLSALPLELALRLSLAQRHRALVVVGADGRLAERAAFPIAPANETRAPGGSP